MSPHILESLQLLVGLATLPEPPVARLNALERHPSVRRGRLGRVLRRACGSDATRWVLRFAIGRALAAELGHPVRDRFTVADLVARVGDKVGPPVLVLARAAGPLVARGILTLDPPAELGLGRGILGWIVGEDRTGATVPPIEPDPNVVALPALREAGARIARVFDAGRPGVVSCADGDLAFAVCAAFASARGRRLSAWRGRGDAEELAPLLPALLLAADADGADLAVHLGGGESLSWGARRPVVDLLRRDGPAALLFVQEVTSAGICLPEPAQIVDLEPLRARVPLSDLARALHVEAGSATSLGMLQRVVAERPLDDAVAPGCPRPARAPAVLVRDDAQHVADERWEAPRETLDGLVIDESTRAILDGVVARVRDGGRCVVLLHGPPGTGKSYAARCIAGSLGRALYRAEGSNLRGRLFGDEERWIAEVFEAAERRGSVLLFDEVDGWMGRREGSSAAVGAGRIMECSELLGRLERYQGIAVLTTNRTEVLDPALARRVDVWLPLPLPGPIERMALWSIALGDDRPTRPGDLMLLAAITLSGGDIVAAVREAGTRGGGSRPWWRPPSGARTSGGRPGERRDGPVARIPDEGGGPEPAGGGGGLPCFRVRDSIREAPTAPAPVLDGLPFHRGAFMTFQQFLSAALQRALDDERGGRDAGEFAETRRLCRAGVLSNWTALTGPRFLEQALWCVASQSRKYSVHLKYREDQITLFRGCDPDQVVADAEAIRSEWATYKRAMSLKMVDAVIAIAREIVELKWETFRGYYLELPADPETESAADWATVLGRLSTFDRVKRATAWYLLRNCLGARVFKPDVHINDITHRFFGPGATADVDLVAGVHEHWPAVCQDARLLPVHIGEVDYILWWDAQARAAERRRVANLLPQSG